MNTAPCPHCETILEVEPGVATVCGVCGQQFTAAEPVAVPVAAAPAAKVSAPRAWNWVWWLLVVLLVVPLAVIVIGAVSVVASSGNTSAKDLVATMFGGVLGIAVVVGLFVWAVLWLTFPIFVYVLLRRILRAIEALKK